VSTPAAAPEAREPTMICQFCKDDGERSRITIGGGCSSALTHAPYYDEDGEWVQPPSEVWDMTGYRCSRGHDWRVRRQHGKPDEIIADETAVTAAPARPAPQGAPDLDALIANLRTVPHGVFSRGHDNGEKLPVGEWCRDAVTALATLRAQAVAGAEDTKERTRIATLLRTLAADCEADGGHFVPLAKGYAVQIAFLLSPERAP
jgi:hypothetical protein